MNVMENKKTITLALLVFSLSFMLLFSDKGFLQTAYAQFAIINLSTANSPNFVYAYDSGLTQYLVVARTASNNEALSVFNMDSGALIRSISLITDMGNGLFVDMYCSGTNCYVLGSSVTSGAGSADISAYNIATGSLVGKYNFTGGMSTTAGGALVVTGDIEQTVTVFVTDGSDTYYLVLNASTNPFTLVNTIDTNVGNNGVEDAEVQTVSSINYLAWITDGASNQFQLWNRGTSAQVCQSTTGTTTEDITTYSSAWVISDNEQILRKNNSCTTTATISSSQLCNNGGTEPVRAVSSSDFRSEIYANCDENVANPRIVVINATSNTRITTLTLDGSAGTNHDGIVYNRDTDTLSTVMTSNSKTRIYYFGSPTTVNPSPNQEFCDDSANANVLICRLEENQGSLTGSSALLNQSGTNIVCMVGILQCTQGSDGNFTPDNPDIKTNGVGYLMVIVALGVMVGILWVASRGQLQEVPTFIWFLGTLAILGSTTAMGWIDPTFLVIGAFVVIALAVAKVKGVFGGQTTFSGEMA